jgi:16S rRNA (cytidine1402-2'-O)-methyltransferase
MTDASHTGTIYVVSTPIGNLEDISARAVRILSSVDLIAAEDTRTTGNLLTHIGIRKPLISYFDHNEARRTPELLDRLRAGESIALVTDAGTPGISDPAYRILSAAAEENIPISAIPGPCAFLPALIASGIEPRRFTFEGFLPVKKGRRTKLEELADEPFTIILYESPYRILRTLKDLKEHLGDRQASVSRELTKKFEETVRGTLSTLIAHFGSREPRGEFVIVVEGKEKFKIQK